MKRLTVKYEDRIFMPKAMCSVGRDGLVDDCDSCIECCENNLDDMCNDCPIQECFNRLAEYEDTGLMPEKIQAMDKEFSAQAKELMEYRNIGTVEEIREATEKITIAFEYELFDNQSIIKETMEKLRKIVDEFMEYRAIGTVEECREAMERQKEKKPVLCMNEKSEMCVDYADGHGKYKTKMNNWWRCPCCNKVVGQRVISHKHIHDQRKRNYCANCGQAIDWSEIE